MRFIIYILITYSECLPHLKESRSDLRRVADHYRCSRGLQFILFESFGCVY